MSLNSSNTPVQNPVTSPSNALSVDTSGQQQNGQNEPRKPFWRRVGMVAGLLAWTFFGFALAQAIGLAVVFVLQSAGVPLDTFDQTAFNAIANTIIYALAILIIIGVPRLIKKRNTALEELGLQRWLKGKDLLWLLLGVFAYLILTITVTMVARLLFPTGDYEQAQDTGFSQLVYQWQYIAAFVSLVVVAPVAEEIMFRGYLFGKLRKYASLWLSVILSALLFAVAHFQWNVGLDTFALGVILALLRVWTGSLWASILLHMLKNGIAFYFLFVNPFIL